MEKILLAYDLPKETVTAIMILYKETKAMLCSPDGDMDFFDIVARVLQGDILAPFLFIIFLNYIIWMSIDLMNENGFALKKARSIPYPAKTITDADYTDDLAFLTNTHAQVESQNISTFLVDFYGILFLVTEFQCCRDW